MSEFSLLSVYIANFSHYFSFAEARKLKPNTFHYR
jgi:hypothetical protein